VTAERRPSPDVDRVGAFGEPSGPSLDEALRLFAHLRSRPEEGAAVASLLAAHARRALPEPLRVAVAAALVDRGESPAALRLLASATSVPALTLRADVLAATGDVTAAIASIERVLYLDIDAPGALERRSRWRSSLGLESPASAGAPRNASATLATTKPEAPFRLLREVGRGGAGTVYEAEDRELGRRVALKIYHRADRDRGQLLHETRVAVALAGAGVVRVFDVDPAEGWLAMEWAPLGALRTLLRLPDPTLLPFDRWALPLAQALARVHAAGWVHHDVKPANVLLCAPGAPLLTDFATARRIGEPSPPGSRGYVSPERLAGRTSDPRDDVYGFGRIVEDALEAMGGHARAGAPSDGTIDWAGLAAACTGPDAARPPTAAALVTALERRQDLERG
jgi:hypothetical protein